MTLELFDIAKLLDKLGLRSHPDLLFLLKIVQDANAHIREIVLQYISDNWLEYETVYEDDNNKAIITELKFIPVVNSDGTFCRMARVSEAGHRDNSGGRRKLT